MSQWKTRHVYKIGNTTFRIKLRLNGVREEYEIEVKIHYSGVRAFKLNALADSFETEAGCWYAILNFLENE